MLCISFTKVVYIYVCCAYPSRKLFIYMYVVYILHESCLYICMLCISFTKVVYIYVCYGIIALFTMCSLVPSAVMGITFSDSQTSIFLIAHNDPDF
mgnify:CR=1 FL=1